VGAASVGAAVESLLAAAESDSEPSAFLQPDALVERNRAAARTNSRCEVMTVGSEENSAFNYLCRRLGAKGFPGRTGLAEDGGDWGAAPLRERTGTGAVPGISPS
jgi:hypothetical protein